MKLLLRISICVSRAEISEHWCALISHKPVRTTRGYFWLIRIVKQPIRTKRGDKINCSLSYNNKRKKRYAMNGGKKKLIIAPEPY